MNVLTKDPAAIVDFTFDWGEAHFEDGEAIASSTWNATPAGLDLTNDLSSPDTATVTISGGTVSHLYRLENLVTTSLGRTEVHSIGVRVQAR